MIIYNQPMFPYTNKRIAIEKNGEEIGTMHRSFRDPKERPSRRVIDEVNVHAASKYHIYDIKQAHNKMFDSHDFEVHMDGSKIGIITAPQGFKRHEISVHLDEAELLNIKVRGMVWTGDITYNNENLGQTESAGFLWTRRIETEAETDRFPYEEVLFISIVHTFWSSLR